MADPAHKQMIVDTSAADILYTPRISGVHANFLRPSLVAAGLDPENLHDAGALDMEGEAKVWKHLWSAGQGVGSVRDVPTAGALCDRLVTEYRAALAECAAEAALYQ